MVLVVSFYNDGLAKFKVKEYDVVFEFMGQVLEVVDFFLEIDIKVM